MQRNFNPKEEIDWCMNHPEESDTGDYHAKLANVYDFLSTSEAAGRSAEEIALEIYPVKNEKRMWGGREIIVDENSNHRTHFKKGLEYASSLQSGKPPIPSSTDAGMFTREQMHGFAGYMEKLYDGHLKGQRQYINKGMEEHLDDYLSLFPAPVSEGKEEEVVNKYWFDGMIPRKKVLDMLKENMDAGLTDEDNEREPRDLLKETYGDLIEIIKTF